VKDTEHTFKRKSSDHSIFIDHKLEASLEMDDNYKEDSKYHIKSSFKTIISRKYVIAKIGNKVFPSDFQE